jgi:hypothetical protein
MHNGMIYRKSPDVTKRDIAERDAIPINERYDAMEVVVLDATADPLVKKGSATYKWIKPLLKWMMQGKTETDISRNIHDVVEINGNIAPLNFIPNDKIIWDVQILEDGYIAYEFATKVNLYLEDGVEKAEVVIESGEVSIDGFVLECKYETSGSLLNGIIDRTPKDSEPIFGSRNSVESHGVFKAIRKSQRFDIFNDRGEIPEPTIDDIGKSIYVINMDRFYKAIPKVKNPESNSQIWWRPE